MPTKPTVYPDWAMDDVVDPTSGQNNVAEPSAPKKASGWDLQEKPPRQWDNWKSRISALWVRWFDGALNPLSLDPTTTNNVPTDGTGHTHEVSGFLETDKNLSEIASAGSSAKAEARENIGVVDPESATPISLNGDFTAGTVYISKVGDLVNIFVYGVNGNGVTGPQSAAALIPESYRPTNSVQGVPCYFDQAAGGDIYLMTILAGGSIRINVQDSADGSNVSVGNVGAISFSVTYPITSEF